MSDQRHDSCPTASAGGIRYDIPQSARIWNYWMGGKDNFPIDRQAGDAVIEVNPGIVGVARQSRQFLIRAVTVLARDFGIRRFLDIGTGLPTLQNTHEVAQGLAPDSAGRVCRQRPRRARARCLTSGAAASALDDVDGEAAAGGLLVLDRHVARRSRAWS